jgi:hypothetical protein
LVYNGPFLVNFFKNLAGVTTNLTARLVAGTVGSGLIAYRFPPGGWLGKRALDLERDKFEHARKAADREEAERQMAQARAHALAMKEAETRTTGFLAGLVSGASKRRSSRRQVSTPLFFEVLHSMTLP